MILTALLAFVPVSFALKFVFNASALVTFLSSAAALAALAEWIRRATDQIAARTGPAIGGLLTVSFGSIAELVLATFVLLRGQANVVQAQIAGSILATSLLGLGIAMVVGGTTRDAQHFKTERVGLLSNLLILVVIALLLPAVFDLTSHMSGHVGRLSVTEEELSLLVSVVLLVLYFANLVFTLVTHRNVFSSEKPEGGAAWSLRLALVVLISATAATALEADLVSSTLEEAAGTLHIPLMFLGVIVLATIGTAGDLFAAAWFASENRMGLVLQICIGSSIQVALVIAPLLVIVSWLLGRPMSLVFSNPLHLFAIASTAFVVNSVARDGKTTWFEGVLLVGVYGLFGLAFFFLG